MLKVGDKVAVLHDTIKGIVIRVEGNQVYFEDEDGFPRNLPIKQLVKERNVADYQIDSQFEAKEEFTTLKKRPINITKTDEAIPEIDLHIDELIDHAHHLTNYEIVQYQLKACEKFIAEAIRKRFKKVIIIHGKGEGVLKNEIRHFLSEKANREEFPIRFHDASYLEYGVGGATEIIFGK